MTAREDEVDTLAECVLLDHQPVAPDGWTAVRTSWLERVKTLALSDFTRTRTSAVRYAPKVGDVVRCVDFDDGDECVWLGRNTENNHMLYSLRDAKEYWASEVFYVRPSDAVERVTAGLDAKPTPTDGSAGK